MDGLRMGGSADATDAERALALCERVDLLLELNRPEEAQPIVGKALTLDPTSVTVHCQQARVLKALGDFPRALKAAEAAVVLDPQEEWGHRLRALILLDSGQGEQALEAAMEAVRLDPERAAVLHCIVRCASATGRGKLARIWAERARDLYPGDATLHALLGTVAMDERNWTDAEEHLRRSLEIDPTCWSTVYNLGLVSDALGRRRDTITTFYQAAQLSPTDAATQTRLYTLISTATVRARMFAVVLALAIPVVLERWAGFNWIVADAAGVLVGAAAYFLWEGRWLAGFSVPVGDFYQRRRRWELRKRFQNFGTSTWRLAAVIAAVWLCLLPIFVPLALIRLASGDWFNPLQVAGITGVAWIIYRKAPGRNQHDAVSDEEAAPGVSAPNVPEETPDVPAPLVPLRTLAFASAAQVDAVFGSPRNVAPVLTQPEMMPGEYREYALSDQGVLLVRFFYEQAISFNVWTETGQAEGPAAALGAFFGLETIGLATWRSTATEHVWAGPANGLSFARIRVGYKPAAPDAPHEPCFNTAEATLQASRRRN